MKVIAINGSPRKNHNTGTLLNEYLAGVKSVSDNIETRIIHLYDFQYKGCTEC